MNSEAIDFDGLVTRDRNDSLLLYGSYARGDQRPNSDIDILRISFKREYREQLDERISVHTYDMSDLLRMSSSGSLFILHLIEEGKVLRDSRGLFSQLSSAFRRPKSYANETRNALLAAGSLLEINESLFQRSPQSFIAISVFLCRTLLYAEHADRGPLTFSLKTLGATDELASLLLEVKDRSTRFSDFCYLRDIVRSKLGHSRTCHPYAASLNELRQYGQGDSLFRGLFRRLTSERKRAPYPSAFVGNSIRNKPKRL